MTYALGILCAAIIMLLPFALFLSGVYLMIEKDRNDE